MESVQVIVLGGGNVGNTSARLHEAAKLIGERIGRLCGCSRQRCSEAWGFEAEPFVNQAFAIETTLPADEVLERLLDIERALGRDRESEYREKMLRGEAYASRTIDLDILLYGDERIVTPHLQVPHLRLLQRKFALTPLAELKGWSEAECRAKILEIATR
ncbi:MAG: 2-amino-4-hydroxy-6-hydroxymethyldihydropteridine diphosphokinase [Alistipes sp.]|nr:2-amino-4-hydroxy-6-hydroxymethyldihydropteridine diphosphokinase [Alistipes sp.]